MVDTPLGRFGLSICYDLRFPELYRRLADQGAQILMVPSAFTLATGKDHWEPLMRARAIENQCYVMAPGPARRARRRRPQGELGARHDRGPLGPAGRHAPRTAPGIALAEIDLERAEKVRGRSRSSSTGGCRRRVDDLRYPDLPRWQPPGSASSSMAAPVERGLDAVKRRLAARFDRDDPDPDPPLPRLRHRPKRLLIQGRVLQDEPVGAAQEHDSIWKNLGNTWKRFESDEVPHARLRARFGPGRGEAGRRRGGLLPVRDRARRAPRARASGTTVDLELLDPPAAGARHGRGPGAARRTPEFGVISDIDDTVVETGVTQRLAMARTVFLGNARTRLPFKGVAAFYERSTQGGKAGGTNPIFFVSSSPWNLYDLLAEFMELQSDPAGAAPAARLRARPAQALRTAGHLEHKLGCIRPILDLYPQLSSS